MLAFDENGHIIPDEPVIVDYETFVRGFVVNDHRAEIFSEYKSMLQELSELLGRGFYQWINGSFTTRKPRPNDIDVVTFIDYELYEANELNLREINQRYAKVDAYFVRNYPEGHPRRYITDYDRIEWLHLFSTDRQRRKKGFIQINF